MPERTGLHFRASVGLTLVMIALTELAHHIFPLGDSVSAALFLLGLVPIAYGALGAGFLRGMVSAVALSLYAFHYSAPHETLASLDAWQSVLIVFVLGLGMCWPMSFIHKREIRFRREIAERAAALEARNTELTELNAGLESFGYVVSHDIKEPVRAIENYLHAAREDWDSADARVFVEEAYAANRRLATMLQGLLEYSRASSVPTVTRPIDVAELIRSDASRAQFAHYFDERGTALDIEPGIPHVEGDDVLLRQLFGNLLLNAARHNPREKPTVRVRAGPASEGQVHIIVSDDGPGYPPEVLARFAEIPSRGPMTVKTGFGLVIAQRAVRRLGGKLWLENAKGGGAEAHVELVAASA